MPLSFPHGSAFVPGAAIQIGPTLLDDFTQSSHSTTLDEGIWADKSDSGSLTIAAVDGGVLTVASGSSATNDGVAELNGVSFALVYGGSRSLYFEARWRADAILDPAQGDPTRDTAIFVGLADRNFTPTDGAPLAASIGFMTQGGSDLDFGSFGNTGTGGVDALTIQDTGYDLSFAQYTVTAFYWTGKRLHAYVDGRKVKTYEQPMHNIPDDGTGFTVHMGVEFLAGGGPGSIDVDYVYCTMDREMSPLWDGSP